MSALPVKPMLLREPCPDLLLERFTPGPNGEPPRVYPADLACEQNEGCPSDGAIWCCCGSSVILMCVAPLDAEWHCPLLLLLPLSAAELQPPLTVLPRCRRPIALQ